MKSLEAIFDLPTKEDRSYTPNFLSCDILFERSSRFIGRVVNRGRYIQVDPSKMNRCSIPYSGERCYCNAHSVRLPVGPDNFVNKNFDCAELKLPRNIKAPTEMDKRIRKDTLSNEMMVK
ncbi:hypothetical protein Tco_1571134 [Tanacetum coccineum]